MNEREFVNGPKKKWPWPPAESPRLKASCDFGASFFHILYHPRPFPPRSAVKVSSSESAAIDRTFFVHYYYNIWRAATNDVHRFNFHTYTVSAVGRHVHAVAQWPFLRVLVAFFVTSKAAKKGTTQWTDKNDDRWMAERDDWALNVKLAFIWDHSYHYRMMCVGRIEAVKTVNGRETRKTGKNRGKSQRTGVKYSCFTHHITNQSIKSQPTETESVFV